VLAQIGTTETTETEGSSGSESPQEQDFIAAVRASIDADEQE